MIFYKYANTTTKELANLNHFSLFFVIKAVQNTNTFIQVEILHKSYILVNDFVNNVNNFGHLLLNSTTTVREIPPNVPRTEMRVLRISRENLKTYKNVYYYSALTRFKV